MTVQYDKEGADLREFVFDESALTSRDASQREAEAAYAEATIRGFRQKARELNDLGAANWAQDARREEKRAG